MYYGVARAHCYHVALYTFTILRASLIDVVALEMNRLSFSKDTLGNAYGCVGANERDRSNIGVIANEGHSYEEQRTILTTFACLAVAYLHVDHEYN